MTIRLTPDQERRIRAVLSRGAYESVDQVVDAALTAVEQRTVPGFTGTPEELDTLLAEGLASKQLTKDERFGIDRPRATTSYVSSGITSSLRMLPRSPFVSAKPSNAPFNH